MTKSEMRLAVIGGGVLGLVMIGYLANSLLLAPLHEAQERRAELDNRLAKAQALLDQRSSLVGKWRDITSRLPGSDPVKSAGIAAERVNTILSNVLPFRLTVGRSSTGTYGKSNFKQIFLPVTGTLSIKQLVELLHRIYENETLVEIRNFTLTPENTRNTGQMRLNMQLVSLAVPPNAYVTKYQNAVKPGGSPQPRVALATDQYSPPAMSPATPVPPPTPIPAPEVTPGPPQAPPLRIREIYEDPQDMHAVLVDANGENPKVVRINETVGPAKVLYLHGIYGMILGEGGKTFIVPWGTMTDAKMVLKVDEYPELVEEMQTKHIVLPGI